MREDIVDSREFGIRAAVRSGCVLSPKLFCAVLEIAMSSWRAKMEAQDLNLHDGMKALLASRFANDLLVFATSRGDTIRLLEELVASLGQVGLKLNTSKTKILTTQAQPGRFYESWVVPPGVPSVLADIGGAYLGPRGSNSTGTLHPSSASLPPPSFRPPCTQACGSLTVEILDNRCAQEWLGCMLQATLGGNGGADRLHVRRQPPLGRRQCETKKTIIEWNKTLQNHHSTASTTADPVRACANHRIV